MKTAGCDMDLYVIYVQNFRTYMQNEPSSTATSAWRVGPASQIRCQFGLNPWLVFIAKNEIQCGIFYDSNVKW